MIVVSVGYPATEGSRFDLDYYLQTHTPIVRARWAGMGLENVRLIRGAGGLGGPLGFHMTALLYFRSQADLDAALQAHGREITADIKKLTDSRPIIQLNEELA
jgi:uncharacterized protein (TIGR02118 family)